MEDLISGFIDKVFPFIKNHGALSVGFVVMLGAIFMFELKAKSQSAQVIEPQTAVDWMNHQGAIVIDIRDREAFRKGHIIHSESIEPEHVVATVTVTDTQGKQGKQAEKYKDKPLIIVCAQGISAQKTAALLKKAGIEKVAVLKGGIQAWTGADLPLEKNK